MTQTPQVSYLTQDHLGSARVITNQNGAVITRKDYAAFGEELSTAQRTSGLSYDSSETRKGYTGYEKDGESGLEFAQARYYNTRHGRFTSVDPLTASASIRNPQTFNRYSYVLNSPYKFVDPLGLISVTTGACARLCQGAQDGGWGGTTQFDDSKASIYVMVWRQSASKPKKPRIDVFVLNTNKELENNGFKKDWNELKELGKKNGIEVKIYTLDEKSATLKATCIFT